MRTSCVFAPPASRYLGFVSCVTVLNAAGESQLQRISLAAAGRSRHSERQERNKESHIYFAGKRRLSLAASRVASTSFHALRGRGCGRHARGSGCLLLSLCLFAAHRDLRRLGAQFGVNKLRVRSFLWCQDSTCKVAEQARWCRARRVCLQCVCLCMCVLAKCRSIRLIVVPCVCGVNQLPWRVQLWSWTHV